MSLNQPLINLLITANIPKADIIEDATPIILNPNSKFGPTQKAYILKRKPFDGSCTFLEDKLCKIHEFKPFACKLYPFALDFENDDLINLVIHQEQLCKSIEPATEVDANNNQILTDMMEVLLDELDQRGYNPS